MMVLVPGREPLAVRGRTASSTACSCSMPGSNSCSPPVSEICDPRRSRSSSASAMSTASTVSERLGESREERRTAAAIFFFFLSRRLFSPALSPTKPFGLETSKRTDSKQRRPTGGRFPSKVSRFSSSLLPSLVVRGAADMEQVLEALQTLYNAPDPNLKKKAERFLTKFKRQDAAWQAAPVLLQPDHPVEAQFFACDIYYFKISHNWKDMSEEVRVGLRDDLFRRLLVASSTSNRVIATRLALVLSALALQAIPETWSNVVASCRSTFRAAQVPPAIARNTELLFFKILAEEHSTGKYTQPRGQQVAAELHQGLPLVLGAVLDGFGCGDATGVQEALGCFEAWLDVGLPLTEVGPHITAILAMLQPPIRNTEVFDKAVDTLTKLVAKTDSSQHPLTVWGLLPQICSLQPLYQESLQSDDRDAAQAIARLAVETGVSHIRFLLAADTDERRRCTQNFLGLLLQITNNPYQHPTEDSTSGMTHYFWHLLIDEVTSTDMEKFEGYMAAYAPCILQLIEVYATKTRHPPDDDAFSREELAEFNVYRHEIADLLTYACCLLKSNCLGVLRALLTKAVQENPFRWQNLEAVLFCVRSVGEGVFANEVAHTPALLQLVLECPAHPICRRTSLLLFGAYADYLSTSEYLRNNPEVHRQLLEAIVKFVLEGLQDQRLCSAATVALSDLCKGTGEMLGQWFSAILEACARATQANPTLKSRDRERMMEALGSLLVHTSAAIATEHMATMLSPSVTALTEAVKLPQDSEPTRVRILEELRILAVACKEINPTDCGQQEHPVVVLLRVALPSMHALAMTRAADDEIMQTVQQCVMEGLRVCGERLLPLLNSIHQMLVDSYERWPTCSVLIMAGQSMGVFAKTPEATAGLAALLDSLTRRTLAMFYTVGQDQQPQAAQHPDIVAHFFKFIAKAMRARSQLVTAQTEPCLSILPCAINALTMNEVPTVKDAAAVIVLFVNKAAEDASVAQQITQHAERLLQVTMQNISGGFPRSDVHAMSDILFSLNTVCAGQLAQWLTHLLSRENFPNERATTAAKQTFLHNALKECKHRKRFRAAVDEFALVCRGLDNTLFGAVV
eukprot:m.181879 g.181879  ORF g.181879 m.181879 type:complete len:1084 (+) comp21495_c0_seq3:4495-7746(+)